MLPRYLWEGGTTEQKERAVERIEHFMKVRFEKNYISEEGMFIYYPGGEKATMDGADGFLIYGEIGAYSNEKQKRLFGTSEENIKDLGSYGISTLTGDDLNPITYLEDINSLRFYKTNPDYDDLVSETFIVSYPRETLILDILDLAFNMKRWMVSTGITMGNWVSKEEISNELDLININKEFSIYENVPLELANELLRENGELVVIGFDTMQVPRYKIDYELKNDD